MYVTRWVVGGWWVGSDDVTSAIRRWGCVRSCRCWTSLLILLIRSVDPAEPELTVSTSADLNYNLRLIGSPPLSTVLYVFQGATCQEMLIIVQTDLTPTDCGKNSMFLAEERGSWQDPIHWYVRAIYQEMFFIV